MPERTYVVQKTQIGVETVAGTAVAANKQLLATTFEFEPQDTVQDFTPLGSKFPTVMALQKEFTNLALKGYPVFGDMVYILSSLCSAATVTTVGTAAKKWAFDISPSALDSPKTFTVEQGDATRAQRVAGTIIRQLGLKFNRNSVELSGQAIARAISDGITLTASPTPIALQPMLASNFDVFIDPSDGTASPPFGTTKLGRLFDGDFTLDNRYGPFWPVDSSLTSYGGTVELAPKTEFKAIMEADAAGMGYLNTLRAGSTVMCRVMNTGPLIAGETTVHYSFTLDMALKVSNMGKYSDQEGIYAVEWTLGDVTDPGWGKALHIEVVTTEATL